MSEAEEIFAAMLAFLPPDIRAFAERNRALLVSMLEQKLSLVPGFGTVIEVPEPSAVSALLEEPEESLAVEEAEELLAQEPEGEAQLVEAPAEAPAETEQETEEPLAPAEVTADVSDAIAPEVVHAERVADLEQQRNADQLTFVIRVAEDRKGHFLKSLNTMARTAQALATKDNPFEEPRIIAEHLSVAIHIAPDGTRWPYVVREYTVTYKPIDFKHEWQWVATLTHPARTKMAGNLVQHRPNFHEQVPDRFKDMVDVADNCDKCGAHRGGHEGRIATYIVRNRNTGLYVQLGSKCIEKYFNGLPPSSITHVIDVVDGLNDLSKQESLRVPRLPRASVRTQRVEDVVCMFLYAAGWHWNKIWRNASEPLYVAKWDEWGIRDKAKQAIAWMANHDTKEDRDYNLKVLGLSDTMTKQGIQMLDWGLHQWPEYTTVIRTLADQRMERFRQRHVPRQPISTATRPAVARPVFGAGVGMLESLDPGTVVTGVPATVVSKVSRPTRRGHDMNVVTFRRDDTAEDMIFWADLDDQRFTENQRVRLTGTYTGPSTFRGVVRASLRNVTEVAPEVPTGIVQAATVARSEIDQTVKGYTDRFRELYGMDLDRRPGILPTRRGDRVLLTGAPSRAFRDAWQQHKDLLKDLGVAFAKNRRGAWEIDVWIDAANPGSAYTRLPIAPARAESRSRDVGTRYDRCPRCGSDDEYDGMHCETCGYSGR